MVMSWSLAMRGSGADVDHQGRRSHRPTDQGWRILARTWARCCRAALVVNQIPQALEAAGYRLMGHRCDDLLVFCTFFEQPLDPCIAALDQSLDDWRSGV